jgi:phage/plasmid-associated DNA primase|tara:strand:- start:358 stop:624 length:267 start_codon:yes stop_codon:yes gene_type:complete
MNDFNNFQKMINSLNEEKLSELCEEFLTNHEAAMNTLLKYCSDFGLTYDTREIKDNMTIMHQKGDFDNIVCFGIELSENQLYKKFHPS